MSKTTRYLNASSRVDFSPLGANETTYPEFVQQIAIWRVESLGMSPGKRDARGGWIEIGAGCVSLSLSLC